MILEIEDPLAVETPAPARGMAMRPYQAECIDAVTEGWIEYQRQLAVLATGCHAAGTSIMMADGTTKSVEDIVPSDRIMGWDNTPRKVLQLARGRQEMARIVPVKGDPFVVNLDHILTLVRTPRGYAYPSYRSTIVDVSVREWIGWNKTKKHLHKLFRAGIELPKRSTEISPYFMGVFLGDGHCKTYKRKQWCCTTPVSITTGDKEIADACLEEAARYKCCSVRRFPNSPGSEVFRIGADAPRGRGHRNPLTSELKRLGVAVGGEEKFIPDEYRLGASDDRRQLLAGLIDTDGSLSNGTFDYISQSKRLADDVVWVARSLGLAAYVSPCEKRDYYRVCISGDIDMIPTRLPRKQAKPRRQKKNVLRTGFSVELLPEDDFYGFSIEGDGRFLMGDFTVTHNTGKTVVFSKLAQEEAKNGGKVLILAHTDELIEQARAKFASVSGMYAAKEKADAYAGRWDKVVVGSVQTLCRDTRLKCFTPRHFTLIVVDEAHRSLAASYQKILTYFDKARVLGVTATADRGDKKALGDFFDHIAYEYGMLHACRDGWLVRPVVQTVPLNIDLRGVHKRGGDFASDEVAHAIEPFLAEIAAAVKQHAAKEKTVIFMPSIDTAAKMAAALAAEGLNASWVSGQCSDRKEKLAAYDKAGPGSVICNAMLLTEGWDCPDISCVICLRPTSIRALYTQMIGRGTRPHPSIVSALGQAETAAERCAIIKASVKPRLLILDFLWLYEKHNLVKPASLVAKTEEEAERITKMGDGDLVAEQEQAERDLLKKLEDEVRKNARKKANLIDPLAFAVESGDADLAAYEPETARDAQPPSEKQLALIAKQGIDTSLVKSKGQASKIIGKIMQRLKGGLCSPRQMNFLQKLGIDASHYSREEATQAIATRLASRKTRAANTRR